MDASPFMLTQSFNSLILLYRKRSASSHLNRSHFTQVVRNLDAMSVSAQVFDFIFAGKLNEEEDLKLTDAVKDAGDVYLGLAFKLGKKNRSQKMKAGTSNENSYILQTSWDVVLEGNPELYFNAG